MFEDMDKMTVAQLKAMCKEHGLTKYNKLNKKALIVFLQTHMTDKMVKHGIETLLRY